MILLLGLSVLIFFTTLALAVTLLYFFVEKPLARRKMMVRLAGIQEMAVRMDAIPGVLRKELLSDLPPLQRLLSMSPYAMRLHLFLQQGAIRMQVGTFLLVVFGLLLFAFVGTLAAGLLWFEIIAAAVFAGSIPFIVAGSIRRRRFNKFEEQFPEAMDLLGRAVRAGHAFTTGFELIANELSDPVAEEFRITFQQQNLGLPLKDALENMTVRVPLPDVRIFVSSLQIQRECGGNLGEILDTMSDVVRERLKLRRQIQIFTAEGRMSCYMLTAIPFVALGALSALQPRYVSPLFVDPRGQTALGIAAILQVIGYFVIQRMIKIKV